MLCRTIGFSALKLIPTQSISLFMRFNYCLHTGEHLCDLIDKKMFFCLIEASGEIHMCCQNSHAFSTHYFALFCVHYFASFCVGMGLNSDTDERHDGNVDPFVSQAPEFYWRFSKVGSY